jgi:hypothetical protein
MLKEKKSTPLRTFLVGHSEKIAFGIACALLLTYFLFGILRTGESTEAKRLRITIDGPKEWTDPEPPELKPYNVLALASWTSVSGAASADDWSATLIPSLIPDPFEEPPPPPTKTPLLPGIALNPPAVTVDGITLSWFLRPLASHASSVKKIDTFIVERQAAGSDRWETLAANLPGDTRSYRDTSLARRAWHTYRVTPRGGDLVGKTESLPEPVRTANPWRLRFLNASKDLVYIEIEKTDPKLGKPRKIAHIHRPGDRIGWWPETDGGEPTSVHWHPAGVKVDFNTGMSLVSVEPGIPYKKEIQRCKKTPDGPGGLVCTVAKEPRTIRLTRIICLDEGGNERTHFHPDPSGHPLLKDQLCPDHRSAPGP